MWVGREVEGILPFLEIVNRFFRPKVPTRLLHARHAETLGAAIARNSWAV